MFDPETASIDQLIDQVYLLQDRLKEYEGGTNSYAVEVAKLRTAFRITRQQARILFFLGKHEAPTKEQLFQFLYVGKLREANDPKIVDVQISKLRKRITSTGIKIATIWGYGYCISEGREIVAGALKT